MNGTVLAGINQINNKIMAATKKLNGQMPAWLNLFLMSNRATKKCDAPSVAISQANALKLSPSKRVTKIPPIF